MYKLLENERVLAFIGTEAYRAHKEKRFRNADEKEIAKNPAFAIPDEHTRSEYANAFQEKSSMYFGQQPSFGDILARMKKLIELGG